MPELPERLPTPPDAVVARLARQALPVRSLWFPSRAEIAAWGESGAPLYVRPVGEGRFEVGPRLGAMWASVFSPVLELSVEADGAGARVRGWRRLPWLTVGVLGVWTALVAVWGVSLALGNQPAGLPWWALTAFSTISAPAVGWFAGGRALDAGVPWLAEVLLAPDDEEDW